MKQRVRAIANMDYRIIWVGVKEGWKMAEIVKAMPPCNMGDGTFREWSYQGIYNWAADCRKWRKKQGGKGGNFRNWNPAARPGYVTTRRPKATYKSKKDTSKLPPRTHTPLEPRVVFDIPEEEEKEYHSVEVVMAEVPPSNDFNKGESSPITEALNMLRKERDQLAWKLGSVEAAINALESLD